MLEAIPVDLYVTLDSRAIKQSDYELHQLYHSRSTSNLLCSLVRIYHWHTSAHSTNTVCCFTSLSFSLGFVTRYYDNEFLSGR
jgi:hypothetical protein